MERIIKSWFVEFTEVVKGESIKRRSGKYHVRSAAETFAELAKKTPGVQPETVNIRTREGKDAAQFR